MTIELLPWHEQTWHTLQRGLAVGRLHHGLLLSGPQGVGKRRFAALLAQALLCRKPRAETGFACGECPPCHWFVAGSHPDYVEVSPEKDSRYVKIDQIRNLRDALMLTAQAGGRKVAVIVPADVMVINAANSLLKTLEEPPADTLLVLVSSRPQNLPATVRSRCQRVHLPAVSPEEAGEWLHRQCAREVDGQMLLSLAGGGPLRALQFLEAGALEQRGKAFGDFMAVRGGQLDPVGLAQQWHEAGADEYLKSMVSWIYDAIRLKTTRQPPTLVNRDLQAGLESLSSATDARELYSVLDMLQGTLALASTTINVQLQLERILVMWSRVVAPSSVEGSVLPAS